MACDFSDLSRGLIWQDQSCGRYAGNDRTGLCRHRRTLCRSPGPSLTTTLWRKDFPAGSGTRGATVCRL
eukprot:2510842-Karenia_brevis.AAC.1